MRLMYPAFLFGLLALTVPVVIHLLQLRRPQRLLFTNNSFIREVELVTLRHRNVQRWLLLATRVLGLVALVLVFCQPFIPTSKELAVATGTEVLIDNSFSMQREGLGQASVFAEAVGQARSVSQTSAASGQIRLVNKGNSLLSPSGYETELEELKMNARNPFVRLRTEGNTRRSDALYIFSDFQKTAVGAKELTALMNREVVLVPLASKQTANLYVDSLWLEDAFVQVRTNVSLHIRVRNGGAAKASDAPVKVFLGMRQVAAYRVTVEPGQAVTSVVQVQVLDGKLVLGRVVTDDAPVSFDNIHYFTLQPAASIQVLEIVPEPITKRLYGNEPLFSYSFAKPQNVDYGFLQRANLVVVRELERIDAGLRDGLRAVVKRGGSVVIVPSSGSNSRDTYQQLFKELGLGTVQWETATGAAPELREVAMPSAREPFFRNVFGAQQRGTTMPRVAPVLRWARTGTDILRLRDGESYLASFASGAGQVYVFSAPFAEKYSDFVAHALFVPVMYRMAMLSYQNEQLPAYRLTQGVVTLKLPTGEITGSPVGRADEARFRLVKDSVVLIPAQWVVTNELRLDLPAEMEAPGFYQVQRGGKVLTTLAFNQDKRESELAAYSADELRQLVGPGHPTIKVVEGGVDGAGLAKFRAEQTGQPLWRYCLVLALLALLAEALLVRFGGRKAATAKVAVAV
jgi:hypothetical protein